MTTETSTAIEILEIGANVRPQYTLIPGWEKAKAYTLDVDPEQHPDFVADAANMPEELYGRFDGILASHVLEHFRYWDTKRVLQGWMACLKPCGEIHIMVPSWEWAAREVLSENPSPALFGHSFAGQVNQWDVHYAMFTMRFLRKLFADVGLHVMRAKTTPYVLAVLGKEYQAEQHYIAGKLCPPDLRKE